MKYLTSKNGSKGFTLLEVMIAVSLSSIVLGGTVMFLGFMRERWQDASRVVERVEATRVLNEQLIRGSLGRGSGMQGAIPVRLDDNSRGLSFIYQSSVGYYAVLFAPDGSVYMAKQLGASPSDYDASTQKRIGAAAEKRTVVGSSFNGRELNIDYVLETETYSLRPQTNRFSWAFRR